jgi:hypothetical protein
VVLQHCGGLDETRHNVNLIRKAKWLFRVVAFLDKVIPREEKMTEEKRWGNPGMPKEDSEELPKIIRQRLEKLDELKYFTCIGNVIVMHPIL